MPHELDVQVSPASALTRQRNVSLPNSASLLSLQTKVGNRAVCSLVAQSSPSPVLLIQRNGGGIKRRRDGEESSQDDDSETKKKRHASQPGSAAAASPDVEMADAGPAAEVGVPAEEDVEMPEVPRPTEDRSADVAGGAAIPGGPSSGAAAAVMAAQATVTDALAAAQQALVPAGEAAAQAPQQSLDGWTAERARDYITDLNSARQALWLLAKTEKAGSDELARRPGRAKRGTQIPDLVNSEAYEALIRAFNSLGEALSEKATAKVIMPADLKQLGERFKQVILKGEEAFKTGATEKKSTLQDKRCIDRWDSATDRVSPTLRLEGLVVKYKDRPVEGLEADHQPNNDLFQLLASHPVFQNSGIVGVAANRSAEAWTILLTHDRHEDGRTWGAKAVKVRKWFVEEVRAKKEDMTANGGFAIQALKVLHESLKADVKQIKDLATKQPYVRNPQQNKQVEKGEDQILSTVTDQIAGWIGAMPSVPVTTGVAKRHCQILSAISRRLPLAADE